MPIDPAAVLIHRVRSRLRGDGLTTQFGVQEAGMWGRMRATAREVGLASGSRQDLMGEVLSLQYRARTDVDLMGLAQSGNTAAFDELVSRYGDRIYMMAFAALGDEKIAGDAVCEAFVSAYRGIANARAGSRPGAWFYLNILRAVRARDGVQQDQQQEG